MDPFGGLAGDMLLGAILDLGGDSGVDLAWMQAQLESLGLPGWSLEREATTRRHLGCTKAEFRIPPEHGHRHLPEILERIAASSLPARAKHKAMRSFQLLAEAEAAVHRIPVDRVHFHEVGAADAILDICGVSLGLDALGVETLVCGPLPGGSGTIHCAHGDMPCPAPAVVELLGDFELLPGAGRGEMVTPTGAALLRAWGRPLEPNAAALRHLKTGYGAGTRSSSILRLSLFHPPEPEPNPETNPKTGLPPGCSRDELWVLETHLDDETPEQLAWLSERLFALGVVDVAFIPLTMKKGRPGVCLRVLAPEATRAAALACVLRESTALGIREQRVARTIIDRQIETLETPWGPIAVKRAGGRVKAEYEDLAAAARAHDLPLRVIRAEVEALASASADTPASQVTESSSELASGDTPA